MVERKKLKRRRREEPNRMTFTDLGIKRLKPPERGQELYWDAAQKGLALLVGAGGAKTFRSQFKLGGCWQTRTLGRYGEKKIDKDGNEYVVGVHWARTQHINGRADAEAGIDPRSGEARRKAAGKLTYEELVDKFIEHYAKPRQRTWDQTERVLKNNCAAWLKRPVGTVTKQDARELLRGIIADGHGPKAGLTRAWLKKLWRWAYEEDLVDNPIMDAVKIEYEKVERDRVYTDAEIRATWAAADADALSPDERAFVKLVILLAPRKTALAAMRWADLDDPARPTLWTTPHELTKSRKTSRKKRQYLTPLAPLAQRQFAGLTRRTQEAGDDRVFPSLPVHETKAGGPTFHGIKLKRKLVALGAPADLDYHGWRHTIATWLQSAGHSEFEVGLCLNHSGTGVTAGYSHGYPLDLKLALLTKWANHVEGLVTPEGAARLR